MKGIKKYSFYKFLLFLILFIFSTGMAENIEKTLTVSQSRNNGGIQICCKTEENSEKVLIKDIKEIETRMKDGYISYTYEEACLIQNKDTALPVRAVMTNSAYSEFAKMSFIKGTFLNKDACENGRNVVVISNKLARKLYSSYDVLGEEIDLFGEKYKIVGIYKAPDSLIAFFGETGEDKVFLPLESTAKVYDTSLQTILLKNSTLEESKFRSRTIENIKKLAPGLKIEDFKLLDYYNSTLASQIKPVFVFFVGLYLIIMFVIYIIKSIQRLFIESRELFSTAYSTQAGIKSRKRILVPIFWIFIFTVGGILIWILMSFKLYVPVEFIPPDNIFDINFYFSKLQEAIHSSNISDRYFHTVFEADYNNSVKLQVFFMLIALLSFFTCISNIKLFSDDERIKLEVFTPYAISIGLITLFISSFFSRVTFLINIKEIVIYIVFFMFYIWKPLKPTQIDIKEGDSIEY